MTNRDHHFSDRENPDPLSPISAFPVECEHLRIQAYLDSVWPVPDEIRDVRRCDILAAATGDSTLFKEANDRLRDLVVLRAGERALARYEQYLGARSTESSVYHELNTLMFESGLSELLPVHKVFRDRSTVAAVLRALPRTMESCSLVDLGCGDGRTALSLLGYHQAIERLFAVDVNEAALRAVMHRAEVSHSASGDRLSERVVPVRADFADPSLPRILGQHCIKGPNITLALFPFRGDLLLEFELLLPPLEFLVKERDLGLVAAPIIIPEGDLTDVDYVARTWNGVARAYGLRVTLLHAEATYGDTGFMLCSVMREAKHG
jgi:hypothetical protein